jgi:hypothetical protein
MLARSPAALKKRRYRRRLRDGRIVLNLEVSECELAEAMLASERLTEAEALHRDKLTRAAEKVLREWCERWRKAQALAQASPGGQTISAGAGILPR